MILVYLHGHGGATEASVPLMHAQTAVHKDWTGPRYLFPAEKAAGGVGKPGKKTMLQLLEEAAADKKLAHSASWADGNKLQDGVLKQAPEEMIKYAAQFTVSEEQMQEKFAETVDTSGKQSTWILHADSEREHAKCSKP